VEEINDAEKCEERNELRRAVIENEPVTATIKRTPQAEGELTTPSPVINSYV
jgi:hypothetical protein